MMLKDILNKEFVINEEFNAQDDSYDLMNLISLTNENQKERFLNVLEHLNPKKLYKSKNGNVIHGPNHIERVLFYANILAIFHDLTEEDYKILMDGASYHDSGRVNDYDDNCHGFQSACMLDEILKKESFYEEQENMNILKAIVDFHAIDDERIDSIMEYYEVMDKERCKKLAYLLKDADALDRVRFVPSDNAYLNPIFLRNEQSLLLIQAAKELVEIYRNPVVSNFKQVVEVLEEKTKADIDLHANDAINIKGCLHGIGFDFFKLDSILKHGILSPTKCKKTDIFMQRNFDITCNDYVHVVPDTAIGGGIHSASKRFIENGISFYTIVPKLMEGLSWERKEEAIELGLPFTRGEYDDELFVKEEIPIDAIEYILFDESFSNKKLNELNYFDGNITSKIVNQKAQYYLKNLKEKLGYNVNPQEMNILSSIYEDIFISSKVKHKEEQLNQNTEYIRNHLMNSLIGNYMQEAYSNVLKEEATVKKVVEHIVKNRRENYKVTESDEVMIKVK